jgi:hypothetical protein
VYSAAYVFDPVEIVEIVSDQNGLVLNRDDDCIVLKPTRFFSHMGEMHELLAAIWLKVQKREKGGDLRMPGLADFASPVVVTQRVYERARCAGVEIT